MKQLKLLLLCLLFLPALIYGQAKEKVYSRNFIMKGKIFDKSSGELLTNNSFAVLAFGVYRSITSNEKGEYEIKFYDNTGDSLSATYFKFEEEIFFGLGSDPMKSKTLKLKRTKIKLRRREDFSKPPVVLKMNIRFGYDF